MEEDALELGYYCWAVDGVGSSHYYAFYELVFLFVFGHFVLESGFGCGEAASQAVYFIAQFLPLNVKFNSKIFR